MSVCFLFKNLAKDTRSFVNSVANSLGWCSIPVHSQIHTQIRIAQNQAYFWSRQSRPIYSVFENRPNSTVILFTWRVLHGKRCR